PSAGSPFASNAPKSCVHATSNATATARAHRRIAFEHSVRREKRPNSRETVTSERDHRRRFRPRTPTTEPSFEERQAIVSEVPLARAVVDHDPRHAERAERDEVLGLRLEPFLDRRVVVRADGERRIDPDLARELREHVLVSEVEPFYPRGAKRPTVPLREVSEVARADRDRRTQRSHRLQG